MSIFLRKEDARSRIRHEQVTKNAGTDEFVLILSGICRLRRFWMDYWMEVLWE
jgi:hypothetical protein